MSENNLFLLFVSDIMNPKLSGKDNVKSFNFDYSYWSHTDVRKI